jgi:WD40 repeat protein
VLSVAFSPNGRHIVSGSEDNTVRIWDSESQQQIGQPLSGHANPVSPVAFSPTAGPIISGSQDKKLHILDADGQQQITKLHSDEISSSPFIAPYQSLFSDQNPGNLSINLLHPGTSYLSPSLALQPDGWLVGPNNELLLWIPNQLVNRLPQPFLVGICGEPPMITFDSKTFYHGKQWTRCKTG